MAITRQPANVSVFAGQAATFAVQVTGTAPYTYQWQRGTVDIPGETNSSYTLPAATINDNGATFRAKVGNPLVQNVLSDPATLTVLSDDGRKILFSFSESGTTETNSGNLGGAGVYLLNAGYPAASANVPGGDFRRAGNLCPGRFRQQWRFHGGEPQPGTDGITAGFGVAGPAIHSFRNA